MGSFQLGNTQCQIRTIEAHIIISYFTCDSSTGALQDMMSLSIWPDAISRRFDGLQDSGIARTMIR
jgi:hypothetical protein